jgi:hypothetical protein
MVRVEFSGALVSACVVRDARVVTRVLTGPNPELPAVPNPDGIIKEAMIDEVIEVEKSNWRTFRMQARRRV